MRKKTRIAALGATTAVAALGFWLLPRGHAAEEQAFRIGTVERGTVEAVVSATGALGAVTTVQVGTQVSGQVSALYADFNDVVHKGDLIARIDPTLSEQAVADAEAGLERSRAELTKAQQDRDRTVQLHDNKIVTDVELNTAEYQLALAQASVRSAEVALARAQRNLGYTRIYAPIDGIVVERNVDVGQTVAASLSAPQIFLIAQDLSEMQILASVDESDIAQIKEGAPVRFTVQAYQNRTFDGRVRQVRLQSATQENVVSYTVVVAVANPDGALLPGMTATVDFLTAVAQDVLTVPNAAVRFQPSEALLAEFKAQSPAAGTRAQGEQRPAGTSGSPADVVEGQQPAGEESVAVQHQTLLWHLDASGKLADLPVRTGISDGQKTQVEGDGLRQGMQVILGTRQAGSGAEVSESNANPFQQEQRRGGPPGPPGGF